MMLLSCTVFVSNSDCSLPKQGLSWQVEHVCALTSKFDVVSSDGSESFPVQGLV